MKQIPFGPKHIIRETQTAINELCAPLFAKLDLNYFHYIRLYKDGTMTNLLSRYDWHECFYTNQFRTTVPLVNPEIKFGQYNVCLWRGTVSDHALATARNETNLDHPINITVVQKDYFECFAFGARAGNDAVINTYFNNIELLLNYTRSFKEQAADLIKVSVANKFLLPQAQHAKNLTILDNLDTALTLVGNYGVVKVTFKELEALRWLCKGLSLNEIAKKVRRSARTVEMHLNNLKDKLGCRKKAELIEMGLNNNISVYY